MEMKFSDAPAKKNTKIISSLSSLVAPLVTGVFSIYSPLSYFWMCLFMP